MRAFKQQACQSWALFKKVCFIEIDFKKLVGLRPKIAYSKQVQTAQKNVRLE